MKLCEELQFSADELRRFQVDFGIKPLIPK
jgi:hypothetical protein